MIEEIKIIVQNYINSIKLCTLMTGTMTMGGIFVNDKITIPMELVRGNLINASKPGDRVRFLRNHGGNEFYIVEIIDRAFVMKGAVISLSRDGSTYEYKVEDVNYDTRS